MTYSYQVNQIKIATLIEQSAIELNILHLRIAKHYAHSF